MPTGYTAGIIDGTTKTFQDFAKQCMRQFGALIHMRDENMDKEYEPSELSNYHNEQLQKAKESLQRAEKLTDFELIEMREKELKKDKKYLIKRIKETKIVRIKLDNFLEKAKLFTPPTEEHEGIANFMVEQLESTINHDGETKYYDERLTDVYLQLKNINANTTRFSLIENANKDIKYHLKGKREDFKRCYDSNKWVTDFLLALEQL